jgi:hypothetical protein
MASTNEVTLLLQRWKDGDGDAVKHLTPIVYNELRRLAGAYLRNQSPGQTLQPTALVHEAYIRLVAKTFRTGSLADISSP